MTKLVLGMLGGGVLGYRRGNTPEGIGRGLIRGSATGVGTGLSASLGAGVGQHVDSPVAKALLMRGGMGAGRGLGYGLAGKAIGKPAGVRRDDGGRLKAGAESQSWLLGKAGVADGYGGGDDAPAAPRHMRGWQWKALQNMENEQEGDWMPRLFKNDATPLPEL